MYQASLQILGLIEFCSKKTGIYNLVFLVRGVISKVLCFVKDQA